eukprot:GHVR01060284.1.p1 GENE.GHVR01060284.1~~GHVR01060284.1.p1  ORF type:complete len:188 (+),score=33.06 GHVR01060284.1:712-1275(+)
MTNHHTKVPEEDADIILAHLIVRRNPTCGVFKEIIKQAIKDKKLINRGVVSQGKDFWAECGNKLKANINDNNYASPDNNYKSSFTQHIEDFYQREGHDRDIHVLFINDKFTEPDNVLSDDELKIDPWNVIFDEYPCVTYGLSMLEEKEFSGLVFYPSNYPGNNGFLLYYSNSKPYDYDVHMESNILA